MSTTASDTLVATQVYRVYIKATPQAIWDAITKPEWTDRYGYGGRADFDLRPGGTYTHYSSEAMRSMGAPEIAVTGEVIESDPPRRLVLNWLLAMDPGSVAEGSSRLTYDIAPDKGGATRLTITHELEGKPHLQVLLSGGLEDTGAGGGWQWVLSDLKSLLETGEGLAGQH